MHYKNYILIFTAAVAALAVLITNISTILAAARSFLKWLRPASPILLNLQTIGESSNMEKERTLMDVTISYNGIDQLVFDRIEIRHWPGLALTTSTGALVSQAEYSFNFSYDSHLKYPLDPPLVLNPISASLLRFKVEFRPHGTFPSSGGMTYTKLFYKTEKGRIGVIPMVRIDAEAYKDYPDVLAALLRKGCYEFPIFESPSQNKTEIFKINRNGSIKGKEIGNISNT